MCIANCIARNIFHTHICDWHTRFCYIVLNWLCIMAVGHKKLLSYFQKYFHVFPYYIYTTKGYAQSKRPMCVLHSTLFRLNNSSFVYLIYYPNHVLFVVYCVFSLFRSAHFFCLRLFIFFFFIFAANYFGRQRFDSLVNAWTRIQVNQIETIEVMLINMAEHIIDWQFRYTLYYVKMDTKKKRSITYENMKYFAPTICNGDFHFQQNILASLLKQRTLQNCQADDASKPFRIK